MKLILLGIDDDDRKTIETHLFARQFGLIIKDNCGFMYVNLDTPEELSFLSAILKCDFLFTHNAFYHDGKRYSTLKIIREDNGIEHKNSGDGVLPKEQSV